MITIVVHSLFINCGGRSIEFNGTKYEGDETQSGKSSFFSSSERWGYSSTSVFLRSHSLPFIESIINGSASSIYTTARLSLLSLKYYGFCLRNGSYNVKLHFAEVVFTADEADTGLRKRIFDVSIQVSMVSRKMFCINGDSCP